jgi:uncharacterized glyoxalase superfamily protein PhnB
MGSDNNGDNVQTSFSMLVYDDVAAAHEYLVRVFDLTVGPLHRDADGRAVHGEVRAGNQVIWLHPPGEGFQSPRTLGAVTGMTTIIVDDVDAHHARSSAAGADIVEVPVDQVDYRVREYGARDLEGQLWFFHSPLDWAATSKRSCDLIVTGGRILDLTSPSGVLDNNALAVRCGVIVAVGPGSEIEATFTAVRVIDATGQVVSPGFSDAHVHLGAYLGGGHAYEKSTGPGLFCGGGRPEVIVPMVAQMMELPNWFRKMVAWLFDEWTTSATWWNHSRPW